MALLDSNTTNILTSRTIWAFFVLLVASILKATGVINIPDVSETASWFGIVISIIGMILRAVTKQPIDWGTDKPID